MSRTGQPDPVEAPPRWFDLVALAGPIGIATVGTFGLLLAVLGVYSGWLALALGVPATVVMLLGASRVLPAGPAGSLRTGHGLAAVAAVVLAGGYLVFAGSVPSQNVIATRDPGLYMNTARWLSRDGDLADQAEQPAFAGVDGLRFDSAGVYDVGDGEIEFQFNHLASVAMSVAYDVGGHRFLFRLPALASAVGLLALYGVAVRVTRRPGLALLAPGLMAVAMPLLFVSRNTYSEPFAFALLWGAGLALADLHRRPRATMGLIGGVALGALVSTRVDALIYVALVFPLAALSIMAPGGGSRRARAGAWSVVVASIAITCVVGLVDLLVWTGNYADDLAPQLRMLRLAVGASAVASAAVLLVWRWMPPVHRWYARSRNALAVAGASLVIVLVAIGWLLRPVVQTVRTGYAYEAVRNIQKYGGDAIDPTRTYAEESLSWMAWYLGVPALVAAILGLATIVYLALRRGGGAGAAAVGVVTLTVAAGALYWWNPSITPDQLWASRRFVPAVLPGLAVAAVVPLAALQGMRGLGRRVRSAGLVVLGLCLIVPPAATTWPVRWQRSQYGYLNPVLEACDFLPERAAVVVLGGYGQATLPHTLRSWCGVPVAGQGDAIDGTNLDELAEQIRGNGYALVLVAADSRDLDGFVDLVDGEPRATNSAADHHLVLPTLEEPPDDYVPYDRTLPVEIPFRLHVLAVDEG